MHVDALDAAFNRVTKAIATDESFQQTLIYSGKIGQKINVGYREFSGSVARPAFCNDVEYDLSESTTIGYKGARLEIIEATNDHVNRIDHVALSDDANRGYAIQGELNSPFKKFVEVDVMQAVQTPLAQSSQEAATHVQAAADLQAQQVQQQQVQTQQQGMAPGLSR